MLRLRCFALLALCGTALAAGAQQSSISTLVLGRVDSRRVADDAPFFVKTTTAWKQGRCQLDAGATIEGRVAKVMRKRPGVKRELMDLRFLPIPCSGDEAQEITPVLVAMEGRHPQTASSYIVQQELVHVFASNLKSAAAGSAQSGGAGVSNASAPGSLRSASAGSLGNYAPQPDQEPPLRLAEVRGNPGVTLTIPHTTEEPTQLSSSDQILIDPDSRFVLVLEIGPHSAPESAKSPEKPAAPEPAEPQPVVAPAKEVVELENCVETGCAVADTPAIAPGDQLVRSLSLRPYGYKFRGKRVMRSFLEDAAVRFLGEDQLLVTFNAHTLTVRSHEEAARLAGPRIIRALLFSISTGKVLRAEDWRVTDDGPYLWPLEGGRVLAHVGGALVVYGPGLRVERQWTPPGDVQFVRVSPSRRLIVAGITHERHTSDQHRRLVQFVGPGATVEEDFDLTLLDGALNVDSSRRLQHALSASEVLDTGLIFSDQGAGGKWTIRELGWSGSPRSIAHVESPCPLRIDTLPGNLILLAGCAADENSSWYKIVRDNGKTLLTGTSGTGVLEHADAPAGSDVFALGIAQATGPVDFTHGVLASDFQNIAVSVYRVSDGHRIYAARSARGAVNRQSFALSQSGKQLAMLSGEDVSLYRFTESGDAP